MFVLVSAPDVFFLEGFEAVFACMSIVAVHMVCNVWLFLNAKNQRVYIIHCCVWFCVFMCFFFV